MGVVRGGVAILPHNSAFAGSVATMAGLVRNLVNVVGVSLGHAIQMATLTPARIIGVAERKGSLAIGKDADLVILDRDLQVVETIVLGQTVYRRELPA
jgi:N-acetylglucosamine-6-phosphate deacetylase